MANGSELAKAYIQIIPSAEGINNSIQSILEPEAEKAGKGAGSKLSSALGTAAKVGVASVAAIGTTIAASGKALVSAAGDVAVYGDNIDKMSQKLGISAEAYQEWDFIAQHSGTSMESLKTSFKTLANQAQSGADEFTKLGISLEDASKMSTEDLFSAVVSGLQGMEEGTERTAIASKLLGKGAVELGALLNTSAEDTEAMRNQVHELGGVLSNEAVKAAAAYQDSLQNMQVSMDGLKNNMMATFLPSITTMMDGIAQIVSGDDSGLALVSNGISDFIDNISSMAPKIMETGATILGTFAKSILDNLPMIFESAIPIIMSIGDGILQNLHTLLEVAAQLTITLAKGIGDSLPTLIPTLVDVVLTIAEDLIDNADLLIDASISLIIGLAEGLINALPRLIEKAPIIVMKLGSAIVTNAQKILQAGSVLILTLVTGIVNAFGKLITTGAQIVDNVKNGFSNKVQDAKNWGKDMIQNFIDGIVAKWDALKKSVSDVANTVKSYLGFSEPETGPLSNFHTYAPDMMQLFAQGIRDNEHLVSDQIQKSFNYDDILTPNVEASVRTNLLTSLTPTQAQPMPVNTNVNNDAMSEKIDELRTAIESLQLNVNLVGDAKGVFKLVNQENQRVVKSTGRNPLVLA